MSRGDISDGNLEGFFQITSSFISIPLFRPQSVDGICCGGFVGVGANGYCGDEEGQDACEDEKCGAEIRLPQGDIDKAIERKKRFEQHPEQHTFSGEVDGI